MCRTSSNNFKWSETQRPFFKWKKALLHETKWATDQIPCCLSQEVQTGKHTLIWSEKTWLWLSILLFLVLQFCSDHSSSFPNASLCCLYIKESCIHQPCIWGIPQGIDITSVDNQISRRGLHWQPELTLGVSREFRIKIHMTLWAKSWLHWNQWEFCHWLKWNQDSMVCAFYKGPTLFHSAHYGKPIPYLRETIF